MRDNRPNKKCSKCKVGDGEIRPYKKECWDHTVCKSCWNHMLCKDTEENHIFCGMQEGACVHWALQLPTRDPAAPQSHPSNKPGDDSITAAAEAGIHHHQHQQQQQQRELPQNAPVKSVASSAFLPCTPQTGGIKPASSTHNRAMQPESTQHQHQHQQQQQAPLLCPSEAPSSRSAKVQASAPYTLHPPQMSHIASIPTNATHAAYEPSSSYSSVVLDSSLSSLNKRPRQQHNEGGEAPPQQRLLGDQPPVMVDAAGRKSDRDAHNHHHNNQYSESSADEVRAKRPRGGQVGTHKHEPPRADSDSTSRKKHKSGLPTLLHNVLSFNERTNQDKDRAPDRQVVVNTYLIVEMIDAKKNKRQVHMLANPAGTRSIEELPALVASALSPQQDCSEITIVRDREAINQLMLKANLPQGDECRS
jgi:hypothetical protein